MDKIQSILQNLGHFNSRIGCTSAMYYCKYEAKLSNIELKTQLKQLLVIAHPSLFHICDPS
jgi:hypothetical protein